MPVKRDKLFCTRKREDRTIQYPFLTSLVLDAVPEELVKTLCWSAFPPYQTSYAERDETPASSWSPCRVFEGWWKSLDQQSFPLAAFAQKWLLMISFTTLTIYSSIAYWLYLLFP